MLSKHVLIGGGTGFIGSCLNKHLTRHGYLVTVVSRMPGLKRITWHELERNGIPDGVTSIVNLAGQNVLDPTRRWTPGFRQNVWNSRVFSSAAIIRALKKPSDVNTFINISGVSHYNTNGRINTEDDPVEGFDFMSRLCLEWEKAATVPEDVNCRSVKIRTGVVIGRSGGMIQSLMLPFQLGLGGPMGSGNQPLPWIHIEDLCRLIQFCIENEKVNGIINGVAPEICTNGEFCKAFGSALHRPTFFSVPDFVVNLIFGKERAALLLNGARVEPKRTMELGFVFKYETARDSCEEIVRNRKY